MNKPCGVASNQKVGNFRERIKPRSTKWIIFPPSTELRANLSGCHETIPSAFPDSRIANISEKHRLEPYFLKTPNRFFPPNLIKNYPPLPPQGSASADFATRARKIQKSKYKI